MKIPLNLSHIPTPPPLRLGRLSLPPPFYDGYDFADSLFYADSIDVLTYSISPIRWKINRAIYCEGTPPSSCLQSIRVSGTHAKLWLVTSPDHTTTAYVGSANATAMTLNEIVYRCTPTESFKLRTYFNTLWDLNQPKP